MHLIQLFLPLYDNAGKGFERGMFDTVRRELTDRFGGATAYARAPARGDWEDADGEVHRDDVVLFETMTDTVDRDWWAKYRSTLEQRFRQDRVLIRATTVEML